MHDLRRIPAEFWQSLSDEEWQETVLSSRLNRRLCRRLWAMEGRTDKPPHGVDVMISKKELFDALKKDGFLK